MTEEAPSFSKEAFDQIQAARARLAAKEAAQNQVTTPVEPITQSIVQEIQPTGTENAVQQEMWFQEWRKENRMKKFFQIAAWVIAIGGIIGFIVGNQIHTKNKAKIKSDEKAREVSVEQARKETTRKAIVELSDKHNAVTDWEEALEKIVSPYFTMEVEDILLRKDNRPVLLLAEVIDIERKGDKYSARFLEDYSMDEVVLDCSDEQVRKIIQQKSGPAEYGSYAVIAVINKVKKISFVVGVSPEVEWKHDGEYGEYSYPVGKIEVDTTDDFVVTGSCIDLLFVGNYSYYDLHPVNIEELNK